MNLSDLNSPELALLGFLVLFIILILVFANLQQRAGRKPGSFRRILVFDRLRREFGLSVEAGQRMHIALGSGGILGTVCAPALMGLSVLGRIARAAAISDRPPLATSGDGVIATLSQDTLRNSYRQGGVEHTFNPLTGQAPGLTASSYAGGCMPLIFDQQVSTNILAGHMGAEAGLIADAAERSGSLTIGGSDSLVAQAVLVASAQEPLIGEELFAAGAYMQAGPFHLASLQAQDVFRWIVVAFILGGIILKALGLI